MHVMLRMRKSQMMCRICGSLSFRVPSRCFSQSNKNKQKNKSSASYCIDLLRSRDYENYLCTLLLPKDVISSLVAIRAFNVELSQVRDSVSDSQIGKMRLTFWQDAIGNMYNLSPPEHPVAIELTKAIHRHKLTKAWLTRLVDCRMSNMSGHTITSVDDLETYAEQAVSSVLYLTLECLGIKDVNSDHAASHVGKAIGITMAIRGLPFLNRGSRSLVPVNTLTKAKVSEEDLFRHSNNERVREAVFEIASEAHLHLEKAKSLLTGMKSKALHRTLLPAVPCRLYLDELRKEDFDVFSEKLRRRNWTLPIALLLSTWKKTF